MKYLRRWLILIVCVLRNRSRNCNIKVCDNCLSGVRWGNSWCGKNRDDAWIRTWWLCGKHHCGWALFILDGLSRRGISHWLRFRLR